MRQQQQRKHTQHDHQQHRDHQHQHQHHDVNNHDVYISVDLDCLDPAFAPGVSHREPGGLSTRQLLDTIHAIPGRVRALMLFVAHVCACARTSLWVCDVGACWGGEGGRWGLVIGRGRWSVHCCLALSPRLLPVCPHHHPHPTPTPPPSRSVAVAPHACVRAYVRAPR
jgi:hypothetical protein